MRRPQLTALAAALLISPCSATAQTGEDSVLFARAIDAISVERAELRRGRWSLAYDATRAELRTKSAALAAVARALGGNGVVYRDGYAPQRECRVDCRPPFPEPLLVLSAVLGAGSERTIVMSLVAPDSTAPAGERAVRARSTRPGLPGLLILVRMQRALNGWQVRKIDVGNARGPA